MTTSQKGDVKAVFESYPPTFRELFSEYFEFDGNRAIVFNEEDDVPIEQLSLCIAMALTYHLDTKGRAN